MSAAINLVGNHLLASLPGGDLALLAPHLQQAELQQDQVLAEPGCICDLVHFPERGTIIGAFTVLEDGSLVKTGRVTCWDALALLEAGGDGRAPARAVVVVPGPALSIRTAQFSAAAQQSPAIRAMTARHAQAMAAELMQMSACHARHSADQRMATWLLAAYDLSCADSGPGSEATIPVRITQDKLADVLGVQRTTVTQVARSLQEAGLLRYRRGQVFIVDRPGLQRVACECNGVVGAMHRRLFAGPAGGIADSTS